MSIRLVAKDLYRAQQKVSELERNIAECSANEKTNLEQELRFALRERDMLRKMLDGEKEQGSFRKRFDGFGSTKF